jgi:hypothetical protein
MGLSRLVSAFGDLPLVEKAVRANWQLLLVRIAGYTSTCRRHDRSEQLTLNSSGTQISQSLLALWESIGALAWPERG